MGFDLQNIGSSALGWGWTLVMVLGVTAIIFVFFVGGLVLARRRKLNIPIRELVRTGNGKVAMLETKAGWFKKKRIFFNLIEMGGEQVLLVKDGWRRIYNASSKDYHDLSGEKGLFVARKDDDPEILVPISNIYIEGMQMVMEIAPADFRDAGIEILDEKKKEAYSWWDENKASIISIIIVIVMLVMMIIFFKFMQGESEGWRETAEHIMSSLSSRPSPTGINGSAP